jgi:hypothetical protein
MKTNLNLRRLAGLAGMIGSALFVGVFLLEGALRPGYSALSMFISALSLGSRGWIQITNFILLGLLLGLFAWGVSAEFPSGKASKGGVILLAILAGLFFISGPFVMDPTGTPQNQMTVHGTIHGLAGGIVFLLMPISMFVFLRRFRIDPNWQPLYRWTLGLGIIEAIDVLIFTVVSKSPTMSAADAPLMGLIQRAALIPFMIWLFLFAWRLLQRNRAE